MVIRLLEGGTQQRVTSTFRLQPEHSVLDNSTCTAVEIDVESVV
jgi:hypothetical protein